MNRAILLIVMMVLSVGFYSSSALAVGLGGYLELGTGSGDFEYDEPYSEEFNIDSSTVGIGFMLETNPLDRDKVFSYRFQAGFEGRDLEDDDGVTMETAGVLISNSFAFGGNVASNVRLWAGPQVLFGFYGGESDRAREGEKEEISVAIFGLGVACGINIDVGNSGKVIIPITLSVRRMGYGGETEWKDETTDISGYTNDISLTVGVMF